MDIDMQGACIVNKRVWFFLTKGNGLCNMDLDTGDFRYITSIPGEAMSGTFLYTDIKHYGHKLILVPRHAKEIAVYDLNTEEISKVPIYTDHLKYKGDYNGLGKFQSAFIDDRWIYFVPFHFPAIVKMDMKTFAVLYLENWIKEILPYFRTDRAFFRKDVVSDGKGRIYLTSLYYNIILSIDTKSDQTLIVRKGCVGDRCGCSCITYQNYTFVLFETNQRKILLFDHHWKLKQQIKCPNVLPENCEIDYIQSIIWKNYIFYIPYKTDMMLRLDMDTNSLDIVRQWNRDNTPLYVQAWIYQDKLYCLGGSTIDFFNIEDFLMKSISIKGTTAFWNEMLIEYFRNETISYESQITQLTDYLRFLREDKMLSNIKNYSACGREIYAKLRICI